MNRWLATGVLCAVVALHNAQRLAPVPLLTEFCQRLNVDYVGAGNLFGAFLFGTAVANIPVGILADRHGSKGLITAGAGLGLVLSAIFALTQNYWIALAARFGLGAAGSLLFVPTLRYIVSSFPKEIRGSAMGFMQVGSGMGMVFSLTILPLLAARFDLANTFLVLPALATFILVLVVFGLRAARPASKPVVWQQIGDLARCRPFWHLSAYHFLTMLSVYAVLGWLPTFLRLDFGYSASRAGVISALVNVTFAIFSPLAGHASDRLGRRTSIMIFGSLLSMGCFAVFIFSGHPVLILAAVVSMGLSMALTIPLSQVLVGETFSGIGSGLAVSATNTAGRIAASLPGMVGGFILQASGTFAAVWGLALLFGGARIPFLIAVHEGRASGRDAPAPEADN